MGVNAGLEVLISERMRGRPQRLLRLAARGAKKTVSQRDGCFREPPRHTLGVGTVVGVGLAEEKRKIVRVARDPEVVAAPAGAHPAHLHRMMRLTGVASARGRYMGSRCGSVIQRGAGLAGSNESPTSRFALRPFSGTARHRRRRARRSMCGELECWVQGRLFGIRGCCGSGELRRPRLTGLGPRPRVRPAAGGLSERSGGKNKQG